ncbi:MAG: glycoside hydrolase family 15 protein [Spirochaetaceae bacterium]
MTKEELYKISIKLIKNGQHQSGGYVACPTYPTYNYCWFRDSAYIAYSMDLVLEHESSAQFHNWAAKNIVARESELNDFFLGKNDTYSEILHTRYTLTGEDGSDDWENFQLDSFGIWLWSLSEHLSLSGNELTTLMSKAIGLVSKYLVKLWDRPCYDCWEENCDKRHIYTMATIYGGLQATEQITRVSYSHICGQIKDRILSKGTYDGYLTKFEGTIAVDSSLLGVCFPTDLLDFKNPIMSKTIDKIRSDLFREGGLHRYKLDTYYGGGIWILLTAWLGITLVNGNKVNDAADILNWIVSKADDNGYLGEQHIDSLNDDSYLPFWNNKWGKSAKPLLWSHAMYIILFKKLEEIK